MKHCTKCEKGIMDDAVICPGTKFKKLISLFLCVIMLFSVIPMEASAASVGATVANPKVVSFNTWYTGGWSKDNDHLNYYINFTTSSQGLVTFEFTKPVDDEGEYGSIKFLLYDVETGECIWSHKTDKEKDDIKPTTKYTVGLPAGEYILNVSPGFYVISGYIEFDFKLTMAKTKYCETEPNNSVGEANTIQLGKFYKGYFGTSDYSSKDLDFYKFKVTKGTTYRVKFKTGANKLIASTAMLDVIMNGEEVSGFEGFYNMSDRYDSSGCAYSDFTAQASGYAYLKLDNYLGTPIEYEFAISEVPVKCSAPSLKNATCSTTGVKLTWSKVTGANSYTVLRKLGSGEWTTIKKGITSTSYTDTTAKSGKTYRYAIKAVNGAGNSNSSNSIIISYLAAPKISSATNTTSGVKLTWGKVTGAKKYYVYRKTTNGDWKKLATVTSTSYTDKSANSGTTYQYRIRAISDNNNSAYGASISKRFLSAPKLTKISASSSGVKVTWDKVKGAKGYYVYRKTGSSDWKKVGTVSSDSTLSYRDKTAKKGVTYTYSVKAYNGSTSSARSAKYLSIKAK